MSHFFVLPVLADKIVGFWRKNITFIALNTELVMMRKMRSFWVTFNQCVVLSCYAYRVDTYTVSHSLIAPKWASSILVRCLFFLKKREHASHRASTLLFSSQIRYYFGHFIENVFFPISSNFVKLFNFFQIVQFSPLFHSIIVAMLSRAIDLKGFSLVLMIDAFFA